MLKKYPLLFRIGIFLLLPATILLVTIVVHVKKSLPIYTGAKILAGVTDEVNITFDEFARPEILASSDKDAYFAQGYLHASERLWQMELQRRMVTGRLSEVFGISTVSTDIWMRTLGLQEAADKAWDSLGEGAKAALEAYSQGVNSWITNTLDLPPEFLLFDLKPQLWEPANSLAWQKVFALNLGLNMFEEVNRLAALKVLSPAQMKTFYPFDPNFENLELKLTSKIENTSTEDNQLNDISVNSAKFSSNNYEYKFNNLLDVEQEIKENWSIGERFAGSNAWVISGQHTQSGAPILANDPHLSMQLPSIWYAMQMKGHLLDVSGMSLVGIPGIILGKNENIAWGATSLTGDQQDLFIIKIPLGDNQSYLTDKGVAPINVRNETIEIRPAYPGFLHKKIEPIKIRIRNTLSGPIVTDVLNKSGQTMALRWSALDNIDRSFESFYKIQYAKNWNEFRSAASLLSAPALNFLYADKQGNIGSQVAGRLPIRGTGEGVLPQEAFNSGSHWKGYVSFDELPKQLNPASGIIVSANHQVENSNDIVISHEWAQPQRKNRISQLLEKEIGTGIKITVESMKKIQLDQVDLGAKKLLSLLKKKKISKLILDGVPEKMLEMSKESLREILNWNADYNVASSAASIYHYWLKELKNKVFLNEFSSAGVGSNESDLTSSLIGKVSDQKMFEILSNENNQWCYKVSRNAIPCQEEIVESFCSAIKLIKKHSKSSHIADWNWGRLHFIEYAHKSFGEIKAFNQLFKTKISVGGSANTINVANTVGDVSGGYRQTFGSVFRQVFDLGNENDNVYILSAGQSGHFLSPHYKDMALNFVQGNYNRIKSRNQSEKVASISQNKNMNENNEFVSGITLLSEKK